MPVTSPPISVFLCDDVKAFREVVRFALEEDESLAVVGEAGDGRAAVDGVTATDPDVVLLDLSMPVCDGLETIPELQRLAPRTKVVVLSGFSAAAMAADMEARGASAYLEKGIDLQHVRDTVLRVAREG